MTALSFGDAINSDRLSAVLSPVSQHIYFEEHSSSLSSSGPLPCGCPGGMFFRRYLCNVAPSGILRVKTVKPLLKGGRKARRRRRCRVRVNLCPTDEKCRQPEYRCSHGGTSDFVRSKSLNQTNCQSVVTQFGGQCACLAPVYLAKVYLVGNVLGPTRVRRRVSVRQHVYPILSN